MEDAFECCCQLAAPSLSDIQIRSRAAARLTNQFLDGNVWRLKQLFIWLVFHLPVPQVAFLRNLLYDIKIQSLLSRQDYVRSAVSACMDSLILSKLDLETVDKCDAESMAKDKTRKPTHEKMTYSICLPPNRVELSSWKARGPL